ncbi:MAG: PRC-barrel domain-containing protein [Dehalococcoidia bacterium]|nr:PRC-barrel domain-containing protein [Dehalococcoidia bacterium]
MTRIEDLRLGVSVISRDGEKLGVLSRFVLNPKTLALTHIVIDVGVLRSERPLWAGGWGLSHDRVVPLATVTSADSDDVRISMSAREFKEHSVDYIEEHFDYLPDRKQGWPDASDIARIVTSIPGEPGPYMLHEVMAHAPDEVDIQHNSPVWRLNPHRKIGEVDRVLYDEASGRVRALVIRRGLIFSKDVVLPIDRVVEVVADVVRVDIDDAALDTLQEFDADD